MWEAAQFTVSGDTYVFDGAGWGHQLGMSQFGANAMAREGFDYDEILKFYFPGRPSGRLLKEEKGVNCFEDLCFNFELPEELIAQTPLERRDSSRLLTLNKNTGAVGHHHFYDLPDFLAPRGLPSPQ